MAALSLSSAPVFAAATAADTASNYSGGGWGATPPNNGSGFGAWAVTLNNNNQPPYTGTYLDSGSSVISGGYSWATYANSATTLIPSINIVRPFTTGDGSDSLVNQAFSVSLSSAGVGPSQGDLSVGVGTAFLFDYNGAGPDNFTLSVDGGTATAATVNYSALAAGITISLAVSGPINSASENYIFSVTPFAGGSPLFTQSGTFDSSAFNTSSFNYLDSNTTGNAFFNNLSITSVPEPTTLALAGLGGLATLVILRRRK